MLKLEQKNYYRIALPLSNKFKPLKTVNLPGLWKLTAYLSTTMASTWKAPSGFSSLEQLFQNNKIKHDWFLNFSQELQSIQNKAKKLKELSGDCSFYRDAVIYANGLCCKSLLDFPNDSHTIFALLNYFIDFPSSSNEELQEKFGPEGYEFYQKYLPQTFTAWPEIRASKELSDEEKLIFDNNAILLFDFILERATFSIKNTNNKHFCDYVYAQLLSYFKWLQKNNIFLPHDIQKHVFELKNYTL